MARLNRAAKSIEKNELLHCENHREFKSDRSDDLNPCKFPDIFSQSMAQLRSQRWMIVLFVREWELPKPGLAVEMDRGYIHSSAKHIEWLIKVKITLTFMHCEEFGLLRGFEIPSPPKQGR